MHATVQSLSSEIKVLREKIARLEQENKEHKQVEEAYRVLVDHSLQGLMILQDGRIIFANQTAADITGCSCEELLANSLEQALAFVHPEDRAMVRRRHEDRIQGWPAPSRYEFRAIHKDGCHRWVEVHAGIVECRGRPAVQVVLMDTTSHKQTELALHESETRIRDIAASIPGAVHQFQIRADGTWEILFISEGAADLFERPIQELSNVNVLLGDTCPEDLESLRSSIEESRGALSPWAHDFRITTPNGRTKWLKGVSCPRSTPEGAVVWNGVILDITQIKQAHGQAESSRAKTESILESSPHAVLVCGLDGMIQECNRAAFAMFGAPSKDRVIGRTVFAFVVSDDHPRVDQDIHCALCHGTVHNRQYMALRSDGTPFAAEASAGIIWDDSHKPVALVIIAADITERKRIDLELRESQQAFQDMVENVNDVLFSISPDGVLTYLSPASQRAFGYRPSELVGRSVWPLIFDQDLPAIQESFRETLNGHLSPSEFRMCTKSGDVRWVRTSSRPITDGGSIHGIRGILVDITERKRMEEALRQSEERFRAVFESTTDCILVWDRDYNYLYANQAAIDHVGTTRDRVIGRNIRDGLGHLPDFMRLWMARVDHVMVSGEGMRVEDAILVGDKRVWSESVVSPLRTEEGEVYAAAVVYRDITERKKAEETLCKSEKRYRALFEQVAVGVAEVDSCCGRFLRVNDRYCDILGYSREEILALTFQVVTHPDDLQVNLDNMKAMLEGRIDHFVMEKRYLRKDGGVIWASLTVSPLWIPGESPTSHIVVVEDITERKRSQILMEIQRDLAVSLGAVDDLQAGLHLCLQAAIRASGLDCGGVYLRDEACGSLDLLCHTGLSEDFIRDVLHYDSDAINTRLVSTGRPIYADYAALGVPLNEIKKREGLHAIAIVPIIHRKQLIGILSIASHTLAEVPQYSRDALETLAGQISGTIARLKTEHALRESEQTARALLNAPGTSALLVDSQGTVLGLNRTLAENLGRGEEELIGRSIWQFFSSSVAETRKAVLKSVLQSGQAVRHEEENQGRWSDTIIYPIVGPDGLVKKIAVLVRDITEQRRAQEQAMQREAELLHVTRVSTLGEMASGIAHELNQPLAAIANFSCACLHLLRSPTPDVPRVIRNLELIASQGERAGQIIRNMRSLIKNKQAQFVAVDLNEVVTSVLTLVRSELAEKSVQLKLEMTEPLPRICADTIQMEQVLLNLTRNAIEAMNGVQEDSRRLTIRTKIVDGEKVRMEVCDSGTGLPQGELERIFGPFFTTKPNGLGLGLSISRSIVQMHNGELIAARNPDGGSTFSVTLAIPLSENR